MRNVRQRTVLIASTAFSVTAATMQRNSVMYETQ